MVKDFPISNQLVCLAMEVKVVTFLLLLLLFLLSVFFLSRQKQNSRRLPPGSLGLPFIGQTFGLLKALKADKVEEWFQERIAKHGHISKAYVFGYPTVVLHGPIANKLVFTSDTNSLATKQPASVTRIYGPKNILELAGDNHKRVRAALVSFLRIEVLKQYVVKVDKEIRNHIEMHWRGKNEIQVQPLVKKLTFDVICSLLFGIEKGPKREKFIPVFQEMINGALAVPVNLPFTRFNRGLKARRNLMKMLVDLIEQKREAIKEQKQPYFQKDVITLLLSICDDDDISTKMSDEEIIDNIIILMVAGYDTTSCLLTCLIKLLATNKSIYSNIVQEQEEILKSKSQGEALTWEDITKMKYTWRVASETLRIIPPVNLTFRRAVKDIEYGGYIIPKGWQVMVSSSVTHMDDSIFQNPTMFDPTRFEKNKSSSAPFSYVPFGAGPRMCPGIELSKMETSLLIHHLVTNFTWELLEKDESFKRDPFPVFDHGLLVRINHK